MSKKKPRKEFIHNALTYERDRFAFEYLEISISSPNLQYGWIASRWDKFEQIIKNRIAITKNNKDELVL